MAHPLHALIRVSNSPCHLRKRDAALRPRPDVLRIPKPLLDEVYQHARKGAPEEVCGLLAGKREADLHEVTHVFPVRNTHPRPIGEYLLDPQEQLRLTLHVEDDLGLEVVGFYHSHPAGPTRFSATDAARATWPDVTYLLVHLEPTEGHLAARLAAGATRRLATIAVETT